MNNNWEPPGLREIIESISFMPFWRAYLSFNNEDGRWLTFHIVSYTPDSYDPSKNIAVNHSFLVPMATYNERTWKAWIRECYEKVWRHEIGEFLMFDGVREFAPHHGNGEDPYMVWHVGDLADTQVAAGEDKQIATPNEIRDHLGLCVGTKDCGAEKHANDCPKWEE